MLTKISSLIYIKHNLVINVMSINSIMNYLITASGDGTCHVWRAAVSIPEPVSIHVIQEIPSSSILKKSRITCFSDLNR